ADASGTGAVVERRGPDLHLYESRSFAGTPIAVIPDGNSVVGVVLRDGRPQFELFVLGGDDADGDGVANALDAFPDDAAASLDRAGDGAPDAWNPGKSAADSTTGLTTIDAFPDDAACQRPEQSSGGRCDVRVALSGADASTPICD